VSHGGRLVVKEQARVVSEREDKLLAETMEQVTESKAVSDSESEEDDTMGVAEVV
jgi:translation initiation factor 2 subunit 1